MCPWLSTSTVQVMLSTTRRVPSGCERVNVYRVPVQPGPDTDPSSRTLAPDWSSASRACGLNGRSELKSHPSCAPADPYGGSVSARGSFVQGLPPVPSILAWAGGSCVYASPPTMRVRHPLDSVSSPRFRFRSSLPVMYRGDRMVYWPGTVLCWVT